MHSDTSSIARATLDSLVQQHTPEILQMPFGDRRASYAEHAGELNLSRTAYRDRPWSGLLVAAERWTDSVTGEPFVVLREVERTDEVRQLWALARPGEVAPEITVFDLVAGTACRFRYTEAHEVLREKPGLTS